MIEGITYTLAQSLESLAFLTRIGGLARVQVNNDGGTNKTLPVARSILPQTAEGENPFRWMQPDGKEAAIAYFEVLGETQGPNSQPPRFFETVATLRLVVWLNLQRISPPSAEVAAANVLYLLPSELPDTDLAQSIRIDVLGFEAKTPAVFSRYNYDEAETQFLMWPFDFFALQIQVRYIVAPGSAVACVDTAQLLAAPC